MNHGAQKWVIQRVKNMPGVGPPAGSPENTRTWSMAIRTITMPRRMSTEATRFLAAVAASVVGRVADAGAATASNVFFVICLFSALTRSSTSGNQHSAIDFSKAWKLAKRGKSHDHLPLLPSPRQIDQI